MDQAVLKTFVCTFQLLCMTSIPRFAIPWSPHPFLRPHCQPLPAPSTVLATTRVESAEGRKIWVACALTDRPAAAGLAGAAAARPAAEVITYAAGASPGVADKAGWTGRGKMAATCGWEFIEQW